MFDATYLGKSIAVRCAIICCVGFSASSAALAAESQASSMAGGMSQSGATSENGSMAAQNGSSESSEHSASLSSTSRSTEASAYDSSLTGAGQPPVVKNVVGDNAARKNAVLPASGVRGVSPATVPAAAEGHAAPYANRLIQNDVKQKASDFATPGGATVNGAPPATVSVNRVPRAKVQYWNQRRHLSTRYSGHH
jgi:hypothetical protein